MLLLLGNLGLGGWARTNKRLLRLGNRGSGSYHYRRLGYRIGGRNNGWTSYDGLLLGRLRLGRSCLGRLRLGRSCLGCLIID